MEPFDDLVDSAKKQAEDLTKLTELELSARIAVRAGHTVGISEVRQIELEFQRRNIVASHELKAASDRASRWLIRLTIALVALTVAIGLLTLAQLLVAVRFFH